jgi:hypothetical protein
MVRTFLKVHGAWLLFFVSARKNKRHHHQVSLAWSHQGNDNKLDFTTPWRMCIWRTSRDLTPTTLHLNATPIHECFVKAQVHQTRLHTLSKQVRPMDTMPDGTCPTDLPPFLANIDGDTGDKRKIINTLTQTTLFIVFKLAKVHKHGKYTIYNYWVYRS